MPAPLRACRARPSALLLLPLLAACAGAGKSYPCASDAGDCHANPFNDGGPVDTSAFISPAVTMFHDGAHNSDVDVVAFNGALYAVLRNSAAFAVSASASLYILVSNDHGASWSRGATLSLAGMDVREPKLAVFNGALRVTATAWAPADQDFHHTTVVAASSSDGVHFSQLSDTGLAAGSEAWRPKLAGTSLWLTAWKADELYPDDVAGNLSLFASLDGQSFSGGIALPVGPGAHQGELIIRADSSLWLTIPERSELGTSDQQAMCHAAFQMPLSFTCWSVQQSPIGSPVLFELNGILFVSGEHDLPDGTARTAIWQVDEQQQQFDLLADFPQSEGETGSPGVALLDATHVLVTYHSTSTLDPRVQALAQEPTTLQSVSQAYAVDALAVVLDMSEIPAGR